MINNILIGIISFVTNIIQTISQPINDLINRNIPELSSAFNWVSSFFQMAGTYICWCRDSLFIETDTMALVIVVIGLRLSLPLLISGVKLAIRWWDSIIA